MRKFFIVVSLSMASLYSNAQEVGVRFGDAIGGNVAVDMIFTVGQFSRVHTDLSFGNGVGVEALYDFLYRPLGDAEGFDWYVGVGPYAFLGDPFQLGISGEVGMEYHFDFPLAVGADWRPSLRIIDNTDFIWDGFGLNVRWVFGSTN
jgi:hypothetical protein